MALASALGAVFPVLLAIFACVAIPGTQDAPNSTETYTTRLLRLCSSYHDLIHEVLSLAPRKESSSKSTAKHAHTDTLTSVRLRELLGDHDYEEFKRHNFILRVRLAQMARKIMVTEPPPEMPVELHPHLDTLRDLVYNLQNFADYSTLTTKKILRDDQMLWDLCHATDSEWKAAGIAQVLRNFPYVFTWAMDSQETENHLNAVEEAIRSLQYVVGNVEKKIVGLPDFNKYTVVISWTLDAARSNEAGTSNALESTRTVNAQVGKTNESYPFLERLLGKYPRAEVSLDDIAPSGQYRGICKLYMRFQGNDEDVVDEGSGYYIGNRTVITAAHCLYDSEDKIHATEVYACIGFSGRPKTSATKPERRTIISVAVHWGYYTLGKTMYDVGIIKLDSDFDESREIMWQTTPQQANNVLLRVVGYPGDLPEGNKNLKGKVMYASECEVNFLDIKQDDYELKYSLDTFGGNSGAPVLEVARDGTLTAIGTHVAGKSLNTGSTIGHEGNRIDAFQAALEEAETGHKTATKTFCTIRPVDGQLPGLKRITIRVS